MDGRSKGLVVLGIILLAIGLFATFYQVTQLVGQPPFLVGYQVVTPYQSVGIVLDVVGMTFLVSGLLYLSRKTLRARCASNFTHAPNRLLVCADGLSPLSTI